MKKHSLLVVLFVLLVVSTSFANPLPVPEDKDADEVTESYEEAEVKLTPPKYYSPWLAGFANIIPSLGYFLIDEPVWGVAELCVVAGVSAFGLVSAAIDDSNSDSWKHVVLYVTLGGVLHAPLLAEYKNEQQKVALDLSPGVGLDSKGEVYPTVQLTLSF